MSVQVKQLDFRTILKQKLVLHGLLVLIGAAAIVVSLMLKGTAGPGFEQFAAGFLGGTGAAIGGIGIFAGIQTILALRNPTKLKKEEVEYYDERNRYIRNKGNAITAMVMLFVLYAAVIASAFIHKVVFFTLLGVMLLHAVLLAVTKLVLKARC